MSLLCQHVHLQARARGGPAPLDCALVYGSLALRKRKARENFTVMGAAGELAGFTQTQQPRGADRVEIDRSPVKTTIL